MKEDLLVSAGQANDVGNDLPSSWNLTFRESGLNSVWLEIYSK